MERIYCYDGNGNSLSNLAQYDRGQSIYIDNVYDDVLPTVYFSNDTLDNLFQYVDLASLETINGERYLKLKVPNDILINHGTMFAFITKGKITDESFTTAFYCTVTIKKRQKPVDYALDVDGNTVGVPTTTEFEALKASVTRLADSLEQLKIATTPDETLGINGKPADAKTVGDRFVNLNNKINGIRDSYLPLSVYDTDGVGEDIFKYADAILEELERYQLAHALVHESIDERFNTQFSGSYGRDSEAYNYASLLQAVQGFFDLAIAYTDGATRVVTTLPSQGNADVNYILKSSDGVLLYKWIDNKWESVGGLMSVFLDELPLVGNKLVDYYIKEDDKYIHYRWIDNQFMIVGGSGGSLDEEEINQLLSGVSTRINNLETSVSTNTSNIQANANSIANLDTKINNLKFTPWKYVNDFDIQGDDYYLDLIETQDDGTETVVSHLKLPQIGGGGGGAVSSTIKIDRITTSPYIVGTNDKVIIELEFSDTDTSGDIVDATYVWRQGTNTLMSGNCMQGYNSFDLTQFVRVGTQSFVFQVTDTNGNMSTKSWTVQMVNVDISSNFPDSSLYTTGNRVAFTYTPYGALSKQIHFKIDGTEIDTVTLSSSGILSTYTIPEQPVGSHVLEVYITAEVNGNNLETKHLYKNLIWYNPQSSNIILGSVYEFSKYGTVTATQYDTFNVPYTVYDPNSSFPTVNLYIDNELVNLVRLEERTNVWAIRFTDIGSHEAMIKLGNVSLVIRFNVQKLDIDIEPIERTDGGFDFNPVGRDNNSENRMWVDERNTSVKLSVLDNFDWQNGGYRQDENGDQYFLVKAGTRATFSYLMFNGTSAKNVSTQGLNFKTIFKIENVRDINAKWLDCYSNNVGVEYYAHEGYFFNGASKRPDPTAVASDYSYMTVKYSEEDIIEFEINVHKLDAFEEMDTSCVVAYEDGVATKALIYSSERMYQGATADNGAVPITVGSDDCDVRIYRMRALELDLTLSDTIVNFITDARNATEMVDRYNRNQIYDESNNLDPDVLAEKCPDLRIIKIEVPLFTNDKADYRMNTKAQCIYKNGRVAEDNWTWENGFLSGQGTTSNE